MKTRISNLENKSTAGIRIARRSSAFPLVAALLTFAGMALSVQAQSYSINWYKIAGGGGTSSNGQYSLTGTIGQPDASGAMTGGQYSVTGGFWSLIAAVQTVGLPNLSVIRSGNSVIVSWPNTGTYTLQQNSNLANTNTWTANGNTITTANGTNSITITPPTGNLFFRLFNP
jgi:hypothetical protein